VDNRELGSTSRTFALHYSIEERRSTRCAHTYLGLEFHGSSKPLLGKAVVPGNSRRATGGIGLLGTEPSEATLEQCDTLLMAGARHINIKRGQLLILF
jgi:hypothetical protein